MIYEDRLVAFIDVLGWSKATIERSPDELFAALEPMLAPAEVHNIGFREEIVERHGERVNPMFLEVQYGFFSDSLVFSMPVSFGARIVNKAADRCRRFLLQGYASRGVITAGKLYHRDSCIFGPALVHAVVIEKERTIYPRVLIDDSAAKYLEKSTGNFSVIDHLGDRVANPYHLGLEGLPKPSMMQSLEVAECVRAIEKGVARSAGNARFLEKWRYLAKFTATALKPYCPDADGFVARLEKLKG